MATDVSEKNIASIFRFEINPSPKPTEAGVIPSLAYSSIPEGGGDMFIRNVGLFPNYTT
jgi:hypothetical protein